MTLTEIDQLLTDWQNKLEQASQNLLELQNLPTYQRLAGEGGFARVPLADYSAQQVDPALKAMNDLFQHFQLLGDTIARAQFLRRQMDNCGGDPRLQNVADILTRKSIQLAVVPTPLSQRGLLSPSAETYNVSPIALLSAMQAAFDTARDVVLAVDAAWSTLDAKLLAAIADWQTLQAESGDKTIAWAEGQQMMVACHERLEHDPLASQAEFNQTIVPLINQTRQRLAQAQQQQEQVTVALAQAQQQWQTLQALHQQVLDIYATHPIPLGDDPAGATPPDATTLIALEQWLTRLTTKFEAGMISPVAVGLQNWHRQAQQATTALEQLMTAHQTALNLCQEWRGRLAALRAKALALGHAENFTLTALATQAQACLFVKPANLPGAIALVTQYERHLSQL